IIKNYKDGYKIFLRYDVYKLLRLIPIQDVLSEDLYLNIAQYISSYLNTDFTAKHLHKMINFFERKRYYQKSLISKIGKKGFLRALIVNEIDVNNDRSNELLIQIMGGRWINERLICYDIKNRKIIWEKEFPVGLLQNFQVTDIDNDNNDEILCVAQSPCMEQSIDYLEKKNKYKLDTKHSYFMILNSNGEIKKINNRECLISSSSGFYIYKYLYLKSRKSFLLGLHSQFNNSIIKLELYNILNNKVDTLDIDYIDILSMNMEEDHVMIFHNRNNQLFKSVYNSDFELIKSYSHYFPESIRVFKLLNLENIKDRLIVANSYVLDDELNPIDTTHKIHHEFQVKDNTAYFIDKYDNEYQLCSLTFQKHNSINKLFIFVLFIELIIFVLYYYFRQILFLPFVSGESSYAVLYKILGSLYYWKIYGKLSFYRFPKNISRKNEKFYFLLKDLTTDYKEVYNRKSPILQIKLFQLNTQNELLLVQRIAHDIKNQVHLMNLQISDFDELTDSYNPSSSKELIKQIKPSLKDMYKKTLLLSGFSKLFDLNIREIDLSILLENLIMEFMYHPKFNQIKFKNIENSFWIEIDENLFLIALRNLIENALKYSNAESEILIELRILENEYEILIQNQGSISDKIIEKILAGSKSASSSGSGVGFLISKKIIENINGKCEISSNRNNVVVSIILPVKLNLEKVK
ncbi:MAG: hypothetical protein DRH89_02490, partial [Candidatus Cloacimonadota bacterium]